MTNEELVTLIQAGERDRLPELWDQVERFVARQANRLLIAIGPDNAALAGVEFGDLYNSGYFALVDAVDSYNPEAGRSFVGWLALSLKTAFAEACGYRTKKRDPLQMAASLDTPLEDSTATLADLQEDPVAAQAFQSVEDRIWWEQLREALETALAELPDVQREILRRRYYAGQTLEQAAAAQGVYPETARQRARKALRALRRRRELRQFVEERTPYFANWGAMTGERTTEMIVLKRERLACGQM